MVKQDCSQQLPKLPKGDGTLIYTHGGKILYRKSIPVDGDYKRLAVTGRTLKECFDAMQKKEAEIQAGLQSASNQPLAVAIDEWLRLYKQPEVKPSSYGRLCISVNASLNECINRKAIKCAFCFEILCILRWNMSCYSFIFCLSKFVFP